MCVGQVAFSKGTTLHPSKTFSRMSLPYVIVLKPLRWPAIPFWSITFLTDGLISDITHIITSWFHLHLTGCTNCISWLHVHFIVSSFYVIEVTFTFSVSFYPLKPRRVPCHCFLRFITLGCYHTSFCIGDNIWLWIIIRHHFPFFLIFDKDTITWNKRTLLYIYLSIHILFGF